MIRGYTAILNVDTSAPPIPDLHRKAGVKISVVTTSLPCVDENEETEFVVTIENTDYSFKVE